MVVSAHKRCTECEAPMLPDTKRRPRKLCERRSCLLASKRRAQLKAAATMRRRRDARKTKHCTLCDKDKPLTREHWSPARYRADGRVRHWAAYCKLCSAAIQRERYASDPQRRRRHLETAARQRQRQGARVGPVGTRGPYRPQRRKAVRGGADRMPRLPVAPLVALIGRLCQLDEEEAVCGRMGLDPRTLRYWRTGVYKTVQWDVADRALVTTGYRMEDLWPAG